MMDKQPITREGYDKLKEEIRRLEHEEMPKIAQAIADARAEGDLRENAEYHGQREEQGRMQAKINSLKLPTVIADHFVPDCFCVNDDNLQGAWLATRHLIEQGYQRIAMISGPMTHHSVALRSRGYRKALFEAGRLADPNLEVTLDTNLLYDQAAFAAMNQLLALPQRPDAVFAYNDETALNAMQACREA